MNAWRSYRAPSAPARVVESRVWAHQSLVVPKDTPHTWWNEGADEARVLVEVRPALNTESLTETICGLARDGKTNQEGVSGLLQIAVMCRHLHGGALRVARAHRRAVLGYKSRYPRYGDPA